MRVIHLDCKNCGAPLETRAGSKKKLVCEFCGSKSLVREKEGKETRGKIHNPALARLDAQWRRDRRRFESRDQRGGIVRPGSGDAVVVAAMGFVFSIILVGAMNSKGADTSPIAVMLALVIVASGTGAWVMHGRYRAYEAARRRYRRRRSEIFGRREPRS